MLHPARSLPRAALTDALRPRCLSNIATGSESQTRLVLRAGPHLIALLRLETPVVAEQAAWALGNVAGDSQEFRDVLLSNGVLVPAVALLSSKVRTLLQCLLRGDATVHTRVTCGVQDQAVVRTASWLISNLVRGSTPSKPFVDAGVLPPFKKWLQVRSCMSAMPSSPCTNSCATGVHPHHGCAG